MRIYACKDYEAMSRQAANILSAQVIDTPTSVLGLATGSTPVGIYKQLISWYNKGDIKFSKVRSVNLDEYVGLSGAHPQSYRYFMQDHFFNHVDIKAENTYVPNGLAADLNQECARYDQLMQDLGGVDLQLLGMGHNGHIGFNEPDDAFEVGTHVMELAERTVEANLRFFETPEEMPKSALTMGIKNIMNARKVLFVVSGADKAEILHKAMTGPITPAVPASVLQLHSDVILVADQEALQYFSEGELACE